MDIDPGFYPHVLAPLNPFWNLGLTDHGLWPVATCGPVVHFWPLFFVCAVPPISGDWLSYVQWFYCPGVNCWGGAERVYPLGSVTLVQPILKKSLPTTLHHYMFFCFISLKICIKVDR